MRRLVLLLALLAPAATALGGCRASLPWARQPADGTWRIEGPPTLPRTEMARSAWRELQAIGTSALPRAEAYDAAYAMERYLRLQGYPDATVAFDVEGGTAVFDADPGQVACLGRVYFRGVTATPEATFREYFVFEKKPLLPILPSEGPIYSEAKVAAGVSKMQAWYRRHGYIDAEVGPVEDLRHTGSSRLDLLVPVDEGRPYFVRSVRVIGGRQTLVDVAAVVGEPYNETVPPALAGQAARRLEDEGFIFAAVDDDVTIDRETGAVDIRVEVDPGLKRRVRNVVIKGNRRTNTGFLRRRIPIREGQVVTARDIDRSLDRVYRLGVWRTMDLDLEKVDPDLVDVVFDMEESDSRRVDFGIGWGSWELLRGQVRYRDFNFTGRARYFEADAVASIRHQGLQLRVEDPWILGDDNILSASVGALRRVERFYSFYGYNAEFYYERLFSRGWSARVGYRFDAKDAFDIDPFIPPDEREDVEGFTRSAGLFARVRWDRRDHLFLPTRGWLLEARVFWSEPALGANLNYAELDLRASHYLSPAEGTVLATYAQFASKEILNDDPTLPIQERYFLGGGDTVRAFGQDQLTPVDRFRAGVGGLTSFMGTVELRQLLFEPVHAALFYDVGMIDEPSFSFRGAWGHGPGVGLRLYTPVGPVRADLAYNPGNLYAASARWQFHFAFGFSF